MALGSPFRFHWFRSVALVSSWAKKPPVGVWLAATPLPTAQTLLGILRVENDQKGVFHIVLNRCLVRQRLLGEGSRCAR